MYNASDKKKLNLLKAYGNLKKYNDLVPLRVLITLIIVDKYLRDIILYQHFPEKKKDSK